MVSAKKMMELADKNINNPHIDKIAKVIGERASNGKFFAKLWEGKPNSLDSQLIFVEQYDVEAYNHLVRMGYVVTTTSSPAGLVSLYVGWGFENVGTLKIALKSSEE